MLELVDKTDLGSVEEIRVGSSPPLRTNIKFNFIEKLS